MSALRLGRGNVSCLKPQRNFWNQKEPSHKMITWRFHRGLPDSYSNLETSWFRTSREDRGDEGSRCCCLSDPRVHNSFFLFQKELSQLHTLFCGCAFGWVIRFQSAEASREGAIPWSILRPKAQVKDMLGNRLLDLSQEQDGTDLSRPAPLCFFSRKVLTPSRTTTVQINEYLPLAHVFPVSDSHLPAPLCH